MDPIRYQIIPRTLVIIENGNDILMIRRNRKDRFGFGKMNGVGGHIEQGEDPTESAIREVKEETGLSIQEMELIAIFFIDIGNNPGIGLFVYKGKTDTRKLICSDEGKTVWVNKDSIHSQKDLIKDFPFLMEIARNHQNGSKPVIGKYFYDENGEMRIVINRQGADRR